MLMTIRGDHTTALTGALTGELRPESSKTDKNPRCDANHGGQQADGVRTAALNAACRLRIRRKSHILPQSMGGWAAHLGNAG